MDKKTQHAGSQEKDQQANYNPTARNFDQVDVDGKPSSISSRQGKEGDRDEDLDPEPEETRGKGSDKS